MVSTAPTYSSVVIETPENISFQYELAGPGTRMVAYLIDFLIVVVGLTIILALYGYASALIASLNHTAPFNDVVNAIIGGIISLIFPLGGYWTLFELLWSGQTPGKRIMGIRVIQFNGLPVNFPALRIRNLFRLTDAFFPFQYAVGFGMLIFTQHTQRLGDLVAGTLVVKEKKAIEASRFRWKKKVEPLDEYQIAIKLTEQEFNFITEYVGIWRSLNKADRNRIAQKLVAPIIQNNQLHSSQDPVFGPIVRTLETEAPDQKYIPAERLMREILRYYVVQDQLK